MHGAAGTQGLLPQPGRPGVSGQTFRVQLSQGPPLSQGVRVVTGPRAGQGVRHPHPLQGPVCSCEPAVTFRRSRGSGSDHALAFA